MQPSFDVKVGVAGTGPGTKSVIRVEDLSLRYRLPREPYSGIKEFAIRWLQRRVRYVDHWALQNVTLDVGKGEILGIIGRNGAGKSTLLKCIAGVLYPTKGRVFVAGRVAPLLGLGAGFHPELTGRENVYLYGALLGYRRREIEQRFDEIVDFADLWDFIDSPLRTYSGGMSLRLGFAVATARDADILLVDEVLAVGDAQFQAKCIQRMQDYRDRGTSILFVSHDLGAIREICTRVTWLDKGEMRLVGSPGPVVDAYLEDLSQGEGAGNAPASIES
ncbi:MAG TPA: ABC transporter ATP-binding protein [Chloroflexi bacterium]|nr:ABC transporter ATP-binding protein [Chloroflexota bacterium]